MSYLQSPPDLLYVLTSTPGIYFHMQIQRIDPLPLPRMKSCNCVVRYEVTNDTGAGDSCPPDNG